MIFFCKKNYCDSRGRIVPAVLLSLGLLVAVIYTYIEDETQNPSYYWNPYMIQFIILNTLVFPALILDYMTHPKYLVRWHRQFLMRREIQRQLRLFALQE